MVSSILEHTTAHGAIAGKISHEVAEALALEEYEKFRVKQDRSYVSDFDREVKKILEVKKKK